MKESIKVGVVQQSNVADATQNTARLEQGIADCAGKGAELVVLQELHNSLYFCQGEHPGHFDLSESIPGPSTDFYGNIARTHNIVLVLSLFERRAPGVYHNTAVVIECDGTIAGKYRKMHIPDDPGYFEKYYFTPGDIGFEPVDCSLGRLGVLVCWDQWFPESARIMALKGADLLIFPTAIGWDPGDGPDEKKRQLDAWVTIQRSHAIANGLPSISANRVGFEPDPGGQGRGIAFWGSSFISGPQGEVLMMASDSGEQIFNVDVPLRRTEAVRRTWPFLRDRRIDHYKDILKRMAV